MMNIEHLFAPDKGTNDSTSGDGGSSAGGVEKNAATTSYKPLPRAREVMMFPGETSNKKLYWDRSHYDSPASQMKALEKSCTLYIGNLAFSTRSHHLLSHFSQIGPVVKVILGLDRFHKTPCGFAFVEYESHEDALQAVASLTGSKLDGRPIRVELDAGFKKGREFGRGKSGGQTRDEKRKYGNVDEGRTAKRPKPLQWTPPEQVQQQEQQQQQQQQEDQQQQQQQQPENPVDAPTAPGAVDTTASDTNIPNN